MLARSCSSISCWRLPGVGALHPAVGPANVVVTLMNEAQRLMAEEFSAELVRASLGRLWQASAYVGSYGDLATPQVQAYIRRWQAME